MANVLLRPPEVAETLPNKFCNQPHGLGNSLDIVTEPVIPEE